MSKNFENDKEKESEYIGNIWGWKWSMVSLIIILIVLSLAVCRYVMIKPDRLVIPEEVEEFGF